MNEKLDELDPLERDLYRILKTFMDENTNESSPSIATLSKLFKRSRNTTKKYLRNLETKNWIYIEERKVTHDITKNSFNKTNKYVLLFE